ncbi:histidine kinase [Microcella alkalica]|uniref:histidine kinase n=1 Tax=Microcella alkalica TaxID=355930 RepID=UPI0031B5B10B
MTESVLLALAIGVLVGVAAAVLLVVAWRVVRLSREMGTAAERATYSTLHLASQAATHVRGGLDTGDPQRAVRPLRQLLDCRVLALADDHGILAIDAGPADQRLADQLRATAERLAAEVRAGDRPQVFRGIDPTGRGTQATDAVAAPIIAGDRTAGAIVAFSPTVRPGLVRATGEVAEWLAAQLELAELDASRAALAEAEVKALRSQISPHFIYNALTAIASTITTNPPRARDLVLEFADFTRYSFRRQGDFTTLADELRSVDSYLQLERARFGERLTLTLQVAPEVLSTVIPFLSVQPLVENAVRHGLEPKPDGGRITIRASDAGAFALIEVEDDGVGIDPERLRGILAGRPSADHVGVRNVDARLRQLYGDEHGLVVETNLDAGTLVRMRVPKSQPQNTTAPLSRN